MARFDESRPLLDLSVAELCESFAGTARELESENREKDRENRRLKALLSEEQAKNSRMELQLNAMLADRSHSFEEGEGQNSLFRPIRQSSPYRVPARHPGSHPARLSPQNTMTLGGGGHGGSVSFDNFVKSRVSTEHGGRDSPWRGIRQGRGNPWLEPQRMLSPEREPMASVDLQPQDMSLEEAYNVVPLKDARMGAESPWQQGWNSDDARQGKVESASRKSERTVRYHDEIDRRDTDTPPGGFCTGTTHEQVEVFHHRYHGEASPARGMCYEDNTYRERGGRGVGWSQQVENTQPRYREDVRPAQTVYHESRTYPNREERPPHRELPVGPRGQPWRSQRSASPTRPSAEMEGCQGHQSCACQRAYQGHNCCEGSQQGCGGEVGEASRPTDGKKWQDNEAPPLSQSGTQSQPGHVVKEERSHSPDRQANEAIVNYYRYKPKKIQPYSGDNPKEQLRDYLAMFEKTAKLNGWEGEQKALELATSLSGSAMAVLTDMPVEEQSSYECLVKRLKERFEPEGMEDRYMQELNRRKRQPRESIQALEAAIFRLVDMAFPNADMSTKNRMRIERFLKALGDFELATYVTSTGPTTLDQASRAATQFEVFRDAYKEEIQPHPILRKQEFVQTNHESMTKPQIEAMMRTMVSTEVSKSVGQSQASKTKKNPKGCFGCGEVGHFRINCPTNPYKSPRKDDKTGDKKEESTHAQAEVPGNGG